MSFNVISFLKSALANRGAVPVADDNPLPVGLYGNGDTSAAYFSDLAINITTKTTTAVKASPGTLGRIIINKTGSADTITVYDSLSATGTIIATITAPTVGMTFPFNAACAIGITVVTGGTTAGDYTVTYR